MEAALFVDGAPKKKSVQGTPLQISQKRIVFASVPIGSQVRAAVEIKFDGDIVWSGESETIKLVAGKNSLSIHMSDPNNVHPRILKSGQSFIDAIPNKESITKIVFGLLSDSNTTAAIADATKKIDVGAMANTNHAYIVDTTLYIVPDNPRAESVVLNPDCYRMFMGFTSCESIEGLGLVDTSNVTAMNSMFSGCSKLSSLDLSSFDTSKVTDMSHMFYLCEKLASLDLSNFNTANVTTMNRMFCDCAALTELDLSNFDTSKVTDMSHMFYLCEKLASLDLSSFDTSKVTDMSFMFCTCEKLASLDLSRFDTSKVTDMSHMFHSCEALQTLTFGSDFKTSNVTNMSAMFCNCNVLTSLDVSRFDTSKVTDMSYMFRGCWALTALDLSSFNTAKVTTMRAMFYDCSALDNIYVQNASIFVPSGCEDTNMFEGSCKANEVTTKP